MFEEFAREFPRCAVCHWPEHDTRRRLEIHHLMSGSARKNDRRNFLRLCSQCHGIYHQGKVFGNFPDRISVYYLGANASQTPSTTTPSSWHSSGTGSI